MIFNDFHKVYFNAEIGSYSQVTERENYDSQITLTGDEAELVLNYFGKANLLTGNVYSDRQKASKEFIHFPSGLFINLNVNFPKPDKTELRLYLSSKSGFKPNGGDMWFLFIDKNGRIHIGSMDVESWEAIELVDLDDDSFLREIKDIDRLEVENVVLPDPVIATRTVGERNVYVRNPANALFSIDRAGYSCEVDRGHTTFISEKNGRPFMEAHHLVPMMYQGLYESPLDVPENIVCLCPNCHRAIHYSVKSHRGYLLNQLHDKRGEILGTSREKLHGLYNITII